MAAKEGWKFYVYEILGEHGNVIYVGKGSGSRMATSKRHRNGAQAREVARFLNEEDAYQFEIKHIAVETPILNKHHGGNGSRVGMHKGCTLNKSDRLMARIGTRAYSARMLVSYYLTFKYLSSKVDKESIQLCKCYTDDVRAALNAVNLTKMIEVGYGCWK